jgi:two-component system phosphate regulon response regulator PhoB
MSALILIVEDERDLQTTLEYNLEREGYRTRSAMTGREALVQASREPVPDLVLLDLMLPDMAGTEVCRQLRAAEATKDVPVIMCTAKGEEIDRVVGFEVGADDYVTKPYSVRELMLRVRAILRRASQPVDDPKEITFGVLRIDVPAHRAWVDGREIRLTALEFRLLTTFHGRRGRVQTRERLLSDVWGYQAEVTTRTVDTHVKRLREKLANAGQYIQTVRGVGYRFRSTPDAVEG